MGQPEGVKHDAEKLDWSLLPLEVLEPLVDVFRLGAEKYGFENWRKEFENGDRRFHAARMRHIKEAQGDPLAINEEDGGVYHEAQVAWNSLMRLWQAQQRKEA